MLGHVANDGDLPDESAAVVEDGRRRHVAHESGAVAANQGHVGRDGVAGHDLLVHVDHLVGGFDRSRKVKAAHADRLGDCPPEDASRRLVDVRHRPVGLGGDDTFAHGIEQGGAKARLGLGLRAGRDVGDEGDGTLVAPGSVLQRVGAHLGHEGRPVGASQLQLEAVATPEANAMRSLPRLGHALGVDEVIHRAGEQLVERAAQELGHAPVRIAGASVLGHPYALVGNPEDLAEEQRLAFARRYRGRACAANPGHRGGQGETLLDEAADGRHARHVVVVVQALAARRPLGLEEPEAALPGPQRALAHPGPAGQLPDAYRHRRVTVRDLQLMYKYFRANRP